MVEYDCSHLSARHADNLVASVAKPPVADNTSGVNDECSHSLFICPLFDGFMFAIASS